MERLAVLLAGLRRHLGRKLRRRRRAVPAGFGQVIADVLLVEAGLHLPGPVLIGGPEAARVRRQALVDQDHLVVQPAELELRVGDDDAALAGVVPPEAVYGQGAQGDGVGGLFADKLRGLLERDVLVVALIGLRGRGEYRLEQLLRFLQPLRELDAAEAARLAGL